MKSSQRNCQSFVPEIERSGVVAADQRAPRDRGRSAPRTPRPSHSRSGGTRRPSTPSPPSVGGYPSRSVLTGPVLDEVAAQPQRPRPGVRDGLVVPLIGAVEVPEGHPLVLEVAVPEELAADPDLDRSAATCDLEDPRSAPAPSCSIGGETHAAAFARERLGLLDQGRRVQVTEPPDQAGSCRPACPGSTLTTVESSREYSACRSRISRPSRPVTGCGIMLSMKTGRNVKDRNAVLVELGPEDHRGEGLGVALVEDEVAQGVGDQDALVDLEALQDVRMVADQEIGPRVDGVPAKLPVAEGRARAEPELRASPATRIRRRRSTAEAPEPRRRVDLVHLGRPRRIAAPAGPASFPPSAGSPRQRPRIDVVLDPGVKLHDREVGQRAE